MNYTANSAVLKILRIQDYKKRFQQIYKIVYIPDIIQPLPIRLYNGVHRVLSDGAKRNIPTIQREIDAVVCSETIPTENNKYVGSTAKPNRPFSYH
jgi:hypothetical protein